MFGFRIVAGHVGSFAKTGQVRTAEQTSLSFINGVPVFERFFLGDEFTIRGYSTRSISPLVPLDFFLSSRDVRLSAVGSGTVEDVPNLPTTLREQLVALGTFTGATGSNSLRLSQRDARFLGGDTQLLGNFESPASLPHPLCCLFRRVWHLLQPRDRIQTFPRMSWPTPFLCRWRGVLSSRRHRNNPRASPRPRLARRPHRARPPTGRWRSSPTA